MTLTLSLQHELKSQYTPTKRAMQVAVMFGLSFDEDQTRTLIPPTQLTIKPGQITFITGISGGGKSTLLRLIHEQLATIAQKEDESQPSVVCMSALPALADLPLVDAMARPEMDPPATQSPATFNDVCRWLSRAGLNDARVMLRRPCELSEGQRHRLQLAQAIAIAERRTDPWSVVLADEFCSTLDRTTAHALVRSIRKWVRGSQICFIAATAQDDLLEPLEPDVLVEVSPCGGCEVHARQSDVFPKANDTAQ